MEANEFDAMEKHRGKGGLYFLRNNVRCARVPEIYYHHLYIAEVDGANSVWIALFRNRLENTALGIGHAIYRIIVRVRHLTYILIY